MDATVPVAAFLMGAMGSLHCAVMCGPLSGVLCAPAAGKSAHASASLTQLGRMITYATFGAIAGAAGGAVGSFVPPTALRVGSRILVAVVLLSVGLYLAGVVRPRWVQRAGSFGERLRASLFGRFGSSTFGQVARGVVWGTLPCGLVYGAVALALTSGSAVLGAASMAAFFAGTLPALVVAGVIARLLRTRSVSVRLRRAVGVLLVASGAMHVAIAAMDAGAVEPPKEELRPCCAARHAQANANP